MFLLGLALTFIGFIIVVLTASVIPLDTSSTNLLIGMATVLAAITGLYLYKAPWKRKRRKQ